MNGEKVEFSICLNRSDAQNVYSFWIRARTKRLFQSNHIYVFDWIRWKKNEVHDQQKYDNSKKNRRRAHCSRQYSRANIEWDFRCTHTHDAQQTINNKNNVEQQKRKRRTQTRDDDHWPQWNMKISKQKHSRLKNYVKKMYANCASQYSIHAKSIEKCITQNLSFCCLFAWPEQCVCAACFFLFAFTSLSLARASL